VQGGPGGYAEGIVDIFGPANENRSIAAKKQGD
jgi:hypothetical protein